jgi:hypothetical protein
MKGMARGAAQFFSQPARAEDGFSRDLAGTRVAVAHSHSARGEARRALAARRSGQGALAPLAGVTLVARARVGFVARVRRRPRVVPFREFVRRARRPAPPSLAGSSLAIPAP